MEVREHCGDALHSSLMTSGILVTRIRHEGCREPTCRVRVDIYMYAMQGTIGMRRASLPPKQITVPTGGGRGKTRIKEIIVASGI